MPSSSRSPTVGLEAEGDGVALGQLVDVGEVLERGGDVGEDLADDLAALEAAEEDRAVQDDVLAQGLGQQLEVLRFGGAAEGMRLGHRAPLVRWRWDTRAVPSDHFYSRDLELARRHAGCAGPAS